MADEKKQREIKLIFTPLSVVFYAFVGYLIYRRLNRKRMLPHN